MQKYLIRYRYQIVLLLIVLIGYFPVGFQILALKNDIIQLDLPVKYYISSMLHRGEFPIWMYSWSFGFPLGHFFTWSAFNPITLFFGTVFRYDLHTLHLEFMFYIILGAAGIWKVTTRLLKLSVSACLIASLTYALSGITLSCSQFLAYIASIGLLPWVFYSFICLLRNPSLYQSLRFSLIAFLLISWSYPAAAIISFYILLIVLLIYRFSFANGFINKRKLLFLCLSSVFVILLSLPLIYMTLHTLPLFSRSEQLAGGSNNFGYLDPSSFLSFCYPFINVNKGYSDTTFLFQNVHIGTLGFGLLIGLIFNYKYLGRYKKVSFILLLSSFMALILSCGEAFFLKEALDHILPGFKWFRFPSFFRLFFLLSASLLIGIGFDQFSESPHFQKSQKRIFIAILLLSFALCLFELRGFKVGFLGDPNMSFSLKESFLKYGFPFIGLSWITGLFLFIYFRYDKLLLRKLIIADLLLFAFMSLPIYTVGAYSLKELNGILNINVNNTATNVSVNNKHGIFTDSKGNTFNNLNVYANSVSAKEQYVGPLYLKSFSDIQGSAGSENETATVIVAGSSEVKMINDSFENNTFSAQINSREAGKVQFNQLWHPFWRAYINNKQVKIRVTKEGVMQIDVPSGKHEVSFTFKNNLMTIFTGVHFICLTLLSLFILISKLRGRNV